MDSHTILIILIQSSDCSQVDLVLTGGARVLLGYHMGSRRTLTVPAAPKCRGSIDNVNDDLIVSEGDIFTSSIGVRCVSFHG